MSTAPLASDSNAGETLYVDRLTQKQPQDIEIECNGGSVVVRQIRDKRELRAAFRFLYQVYVEEEKLVSPYELPRSCRASRRKWDKWDSRRTTRHIVAMVGEQVVGHVRLLYRKDGPLPLEENGFVLPEDASGECEVSKFVLHPSFRGSDVLAAFYRHIFYICRNEQHLSSVIFSCQPKHEPLYARVGAVPIGSFMNTELARPCLVMRITAVDHCNEQLGGGIIGRRHGKCQPTFLPGEKILNILESRMGAHDVSTPAWRAYRLDGGGADKTVGVWRVVLGRENVIAKAIRNSAENERNNDIDRETDAYNFLKSHPMIPGLCHPKLLATQAGQDTTTLLLEDMWTSQSRCLRYTDVVDLAQLLGKWQAGFYERTGQNPDSSKISEYIQQAEEPIAAIPTLVECSAALAPVINGADWKWAMNIWRCRDDLLRSVAGAPQAFAHQDLVAGNCIVHEVDPEHKEFALVDWGRSSVGPLGCDLGPLVFGSSLFLAWSVAEAERIWHPALAAYTKALRNGGVPVDLDTIGRSAVITTLLRYIAWAGYRAGVALTSTGRELATRATHHTVEEVVERYCEVRAGLLRLWYEQQEQLSHAA